MQIQSYPNPYTQPDPVIKMRADEKNKLCKQVALSALGLGICVIIGAGAAMVNARTFSASPSLHRYLAITGVVIALIAWKTFVFIRDVNEPLEGKNNGRLYRAAAKGQVMMTRLLLFLGADPNDRVRYCDAPLHMACVKVDKPNSQNHIKVMKLLVKAGAHLNLVGSWKRCPLHYAVESRHVDRVAFLIDEGAYINLQELGTDYFSPWQYAEASIKERGFYSKASSDPRSFSEIPEIDDRIYEILKKGEVYSPQ